MGLGADFMPRLAAWGAGLLVKSGALLVVVFAVHLLMRKARPALRCAWLQSGLLALLFLPLAAMLQPVGQFAVLPPLPVADNVAPAARPPATAPLPVVFLLVYAAGAAGLLARLAVGVGTIIRWRRMSKRIEDPRLVARLDALRARLGVSRPVTLSVRAEAGVPTAVGWFKPAIVVPEELLAEGNGELLDAALLHELAHIRRGDLWWAIVDRAAASLYWPNVLAWRALRRVMQFREMACDDWCAAVLGAPVRYRRRLARIALLLRDGPAPAIAAKLARRNGVEMRIERLGRRGRSGDPRVKPRQWLAVATAALVISGTLAPVRFADRKPASRLAAPAAALENRTPALTGLAPQSGPTHNPARVFHPRLDP